MDDGLCRRICVTQIPSARRLAAFDNVRINNTVARRAGVPFSFATFLLGKQKKSRFKNSIEVNAQKIFTEEFNHD